MKKVLTAAFFCAAVPIIFSSCSSTFNKETAPKKSSNINFMIKCKDPKTGELTDIQLAAPGVKIKDVKRVWNTKTGEPFYGFKTYKRLPHRENKKRNDKNSYFSAEKCKCFNMTSMEAFNEYKVRVKRKKMIKKPEPTMYDKVIKRLKDFNRKYGFGS